MDMIDSDRWVSTHPLTFVGGMVAAFVAGVLLLDPGDAFGSLFVLFGSGLVIAGSAIVLLTRVKVRKYDAKRRTPYA